MMVVSLEQFIKIQVGKTTTTALNGISLQLAEGGDGWPHGAIR